MKGLRIICVKTVDQKTAETMHRAELRTWLRVVLLFLIFPITYVQYLHDKMS